MLEGKGNPENSKISEIESGSVTSSANQEAAGLLSPEKISSPDAPKTSSEQRRVGGPRTRWGKARSSVNARSHGIFASAALLKEESPSEYKSLLHDLWDCYQPVGPLEYLIVERMAVNFLRYRRFLVAEAASIRKAMDYGQTPKTGGLPEPVTVLIKYDGQEKANGLMSLVRTPALSDREHCHRLLVELERGIQDGLDNAKDMAILTKLYGENADKSEKENLYKLYKDYFLKVKHAEVEQDSGLQSSERRRKIFLVEIKREIDKLAWHTSHENELRKLNRLSFNIPSDEEMNRLLRYQSSIDREMAGLQNQLEHLQRKRCGQPALPKIEVQHSLL